MWLICSTMLDLLKILQVILLKILQLIYKVFPIPYISYGKSQKYTCSYDPFQTCKATHAILDLFANCLIISPYTIRFQPFYKQTTQRSTVISWIYIAVAVAN